MSLRYNIKNKPLTTSIYFKPSLTPSSNLDNIKLILENDRDFIYSDKPSSYQNATDYIYRLITNSRFLCKGLNADYVAESFDIVDAVVIRPKMCYPMETFLDLLLSTSMKPIIISILM